MTFWGYITTGCLVMARQYPPSSVWWIIALYCVNMTLRDSPTVPLSKTGWGLVQGWICSCLFVCWQQRYHLCFAQQRERGEERGQLGKRADIDGKKPVVAWDSAYRAKSITTPVNSPPTSWPQAASSHPWHFIRQELDVDLGQQPETG